MNLTKEMVESIRDGTDASLDIEMPMSKDICEDNLAMWKMLEAIVANLEFAVSPGAPLTVEVLERHIRGQISKLKELLGVTDD